MRITIPLAMLAIMALAAQPAMAQYSKVATPFNSVSDSFHESIGVNWGATIGGNPAPAGSQNSQTSPLSFSFGNGAVPPFGGFVPGQGARAGVGFRGGNVSGFGGVTMSQGNNRSLVSQTPMVTIPNGGRGSVSDTSQTPFVTGVIPVVGGWNAGPLVTNSPISGFGQMPRRTISPLQERLQRLQQTHQSLTPPATRRPEVRQPRQAPSTPVARSTAESGDLSVAEIRRQQDSGPAISKETTRWIELARSAQARGKQSIAKLYYRNAANSATGDLREQLLEKIRELE